ncbi:MAG: SpoIIE family protein phosphatase [Bryobacteraceae bacterium]
MLAAPGQPPRNLPVESGRITIGRAVNNDLCYPDDAGLSRQHMSIERHGYDLVVADLGSKNGTMVNGVRIGGPHLLQAGDQITAGHLLIEYKFPDSDESAKTVLFVDKGQAVPDGSTMVAANLEGVLQHDKGAISGTRHIDALIRAGQELAGRRPLEELFPLVLDLGIQAVGASRGVLLTLENGQLVPRAAAGDSFRISSTVRDRVVQRRESLLVTDTSLDLDLAQRQSIVAQAVRSIMAVPLQTRDSVIGLVYVDSTNLIQPFTRDDLNLLTVMANVAAIRIEHARLVEVERQEEIMARELNQAAEIQAKLLPAAPPVVPGWDLAATNVACHTVGGDYFDYVQAAEGKLLLVVGDVAGKGMPAALMMSSLQAYLRVLADEPRDVSGIVTRANQLIATRCPANRFVTLFAFLLDPDSGDFTYANAGHNPALVLRGDGAVEWLANGGTPLGLFPQASHEQHSGKLNPGDTLVLYSDGISEASDPKTDEEYGADRLAALIERHPACSAGAVVEIVMSELREWSGGAGFADDVTVLVARRNMV